MSIARRITAIATGPCVRWNTLQPGRSGPSVTAWRATWARASVFALVALLYSSDLMAGGTGTNMPWNAPLTNLLNNLSGPTARAVVGIGVALCGVIWMMKRHEEGAGRLGQAVVGGALVFGAQVFVGAIGFAGALV
jgi:type IV secretion system protein VirB2